MIDLDKKYTTPRDEGSISLGDEERDHGPRVLFRGNCGANGYYCAASFRDREGFGGGATPREALRSLAASLRQLAAQVDAVALTVQVDRKASNIQDWYPDYGFGRSSDIARVWALMQTAPFSLRQIIVETGASSSVVDRLTKRGEFVRVGTGQIMWVIGDSFFWAPEVERWAAILGISKESAAARQREAATEP